MNDNWAGQQKTKGRVNYLGARVNETRGGNDVLEYIKKMYSRWLSFKIQ